MKYSEAALRLVYENNIERTRLLLDGNERVNLI